MEKKMASIDTTACGASGNKNPQSANEKNDDVDSFFEKLTEINHSSGLSLIFNFRKSILDLHLLYKEVTKRGGFYEVTETGKWNEIVSNSKSFVPMLPSQLRKVYEILLLDYERVNYCKASEEPNLSPNNSFQVSPLGKRKHYDNSLSSIQSTNAESSTEKPNSLDKTCQVVTGLKNMDQNSTTILSSNSNNKESRKDPNAPLKPRSGYQIFLRVECRKLKMIHRERSSSQNIRNMAIEAWRRLTEKNKEPYNDASKKDKERYVRQMDAYNRQKKKQNAEIQIDPSPTVLDFSKPSNSEGDYHVSLESNSCNTLVPDESMVELAIGVMKNAQSNDPIFPLDWEIE